MARGRAGGARPPGRARRAGQRGLHVTVVDSGAPGAWDVAAGMLAPASEAEFGEDALAGLGLRSADRFPGFVAELREASGINPELRGHGTLAVARDADEAAALERMLAFRRGLGLAVQRLRPGPARRPGARP